VSDLVDDLVRLGFLQRGLLACVLVAAVAPLVGTFVVQRGQSLVGDGLGHTAFAGVGLAFLIGTDPLIGAVALSLLAAVALVRMTRRGTEGDLSLALVFYGGLALGFLFASRSDAGQNAILGRLFGSPFNLSWTEVGVVALLCLVVVAVVAALHGPLLALAFDEPAARVAGVPTDGLVLALTIVVALVVVGGMSSVGLLLISALLVVPVAAAARIASSHRTTLLLASAIGAGSAVAGVLGGHLLDIAPGSAIVLTAIGCYLAAGSLQRLVGAAQRRSAS
jgi:zinc transport system permease protein